MVKKTGIKNINLSKIKAMKRILFLLIVVLFSCSEQNTLKEKEVTNQDSIFQDVVKEDYGDSLFLGFSVGMDDKVYYNLVSRLNEKMVFKNNNYLIKLNGHNILAECKGNFDQNNLLDNVELIYKSNDLNDNNIPKLLNLYEKKYKFEKFEKIKEIKNDVLSRVSLKIKKSEHKREHTPFEKSNCTLCKFYDKSMKKLKANENLITLRESKKILYDSSNFITITLYTWDNTYKIFYPVDSYKEVKITYHSKNTFQLQMNQINSYNDSLKKIKSNQTQQKIKLEKRNMIDEI